VTLCQDIGALATLAHALVLRGVVTIEEGQHRSGARLLGATLPRVTETSLYPFDRARLDAAVAVARRSLGADGYVQAWHEGEAMTLDGAIALVHAKPGSEEGHFAAG
jgi:hypothetical protein